jgi:cysteine synthase
MQIHENVLSVIGHTPLVKLNRVASSVKATLLAKLEFLNPGGSVKDRIGIEMIDAAERGKLRPVERLSKAHLETRALVSQSPRQSRVIAASL